MGRRVQATVTGTLDQEVTPEVLAILQSQLRASVSKLAMGASAFTVGLKDVELVEVCEGDGSPDPQGIPASILERLTVAELHEVAEEAEVEVVRLDGSGRDPKKSDYVAALS